MQGGTAPGSRVPSENADLAVIDQLVRDYKRYGLPLPPPDAPLVRDGMWIGVGLGAGQKQYWELGYLIPKSAGQSYDQLQVGTGIRDFASAEAKLPSYPEEPATADTVLGVTIRPGFQEEILLTMAIVERTRGKPPFALALLRKALNPEPQSTSTSVSHPPVPVRQRLWISAFNSQKNALLDEKPNLIAISQRMRKLIALAPGPVSNEDSRLPEAARLTATQRYKGSDPEEKLIDALCDPVAPFQESAGAVWIEDLRWQLNRVPLQAIVAQGFDAVPALIEHVEDQRLVPAPKGFSNTAPAGMLSIGDLCQSLLRSYMGEGDRLTSGGDGASVDWAVWWAKAKPEGEEAYCLRTLCQVEPQGISRSLLWLVESKHPEDLIQVLNWQQGHGLSNDAVRVLYSIGNSRLSKEEKEQSAALGLKSYSLQENRGALYILVRTDPSKADSELVRVMKGLPSHAFDQVWENEESSFVNLVTRSTSPAVWTTFEITAKRVDPSVRFRMLWILGLSGGHGPNKDKALKLLRSFMNDSTQIPDGPAGFFPGAKSVQDIAAVGAARIIQITEMPQASDPAEKWAEFRSAVARKLDDMGIH